MIHIATVVGARPQFIKAAVLSRLIKESGDFCEYLIHTGQHYDHNMSDVFFLKMGIPEPSINLKIGSGPQGQQTGRMLEAIEKVLLDKKPDFLLVYGDTNSTLAGALAATKLHIPLIHVEAGLRSYNMMMPEEKNRILTDHISTLLFCPTKQAIINLEKEGISQGVYNSGDIMLDASLYYRRKFKNNTFELPPNPFTLLTLHRAENTDNLSRLKSIVQAINELDEINFIFPIHPRTRKILHDNNLVFQKNVQQIDPVGFEQMLHLEENCQMIITDSGGVQKEAYFLRKPCITLRDDTEWVETVSASANILVGASTEKIKNSARNFIAPNHWPEHYGNGNCAQFILETIKEYRKTL